MKAEAIGLEVMGTSGGEQLVKCPFHDDHHASASWNPKYDLFYCFTCGFGLNLQQLLTRLGRDIDDEFLIEESLHVPKLDLKPEEPDLWPGLKRHNKYLAKRGISVWAAEEYGVGIEDERRVIFPVADNDGKTVGIIARYIEPGDGPRYKKSGVQRPLWPTHLWQGLYSGEHIIVTEGIFSALRIASCSKRFTVLSLCGAKANDEIVAALSPFHPLIIYDRDRAGINAAKKLKAMRPDWPIFTAKPSPDDIADDKEVVRLVNKLYEKGIVEPYARKYGPHERPKFEWTAD